MPLPKDCLFYNFRETMTKEQEYFVNSIIDYSVVFADAIAGSGKTTVGLGSLYYLYEQGIIDKVYYVFAPVEERVMGYRPGNQKEKEADYLGPLKDALIAIGQQPDKAMDEKHGWIVPCSHTFLRGKNLERVGVMIDEAQNFTKDQLRKTMTRVHDCGKLVVTGHTKQCDLPNKSHSGFRPYMQWMATDKRVRCCELTKDFRGWISRLADSIPDDTDDFWRM